MEPEAIWRSIETQRLAMADLLEDLSEDEWQHPSLCAGWTVRDVAAHLAMAPMISNGATFVEFVRARGSFNRMIRDSAIRRSAKPVDQLIADIRMVASSRRLAPTTTHFEPLIDLLVHTQDIVIPLGRNTEMPHEPAKTCATRYWNRAFPFHARKKLHGLQLIATDTTWKAGEGAEIHGPISALLLLITGRPAAITHLSGNGLPELTTRLSVPAGH
jgi:uncharacterized protein (TIGR03083 family)